MMNHLGSKNCNQFKSQFLIDLQYEIHSSQMKAYTQEWTYQLFLLTIKIRGKEIVFGKHSKQCSKIEFIEITKIYILFV